MIRGVKMAFSVRQVLHLTLIAMSDPVLGLRGIVALEAVFTARDDICVHAGHYCIET